MKRVAFPCHLPWSKAVWTASALIGGVFAMPAQAQTSQVDIYGYVAPRCWVSNASTWQPALDGTTLPPSAICNQSAPHQESRLRALNADGTLTAQMIPVALTTGPALPQQPGRTAMEIVVSPQL